MSVVNEVQRQAAEKGLNRESSFWMNGIVDGSERLKIPGELGELVETANGHGTIEKSGHIELYVVENYGEEGQVFKPEELRELAFELLALADVAEGLEDL